MDGWIGGAVETAWISRVPSGGDVGENHAPPWVVFARYAERDVAAGKLLAVRRARRSRDSRCPPDYQMQEIG